MSNLNLKTVMKVFFFFLLLLKHSVTHLNGRSLSGSLDYTLQTNSTFITWEVHYVRRHAEFLSS